MRMWKLYPLKGRKRQWRHKRKFRKKGDARKYQKSGERLGPIKGPKRK